ncbi:hypothetical protein IQ215_06965 [Cyanobacterium stanieri LEGE 03274]|uniref:Uncharacterized protein n=1 Tax=Cyanobacterium stanieri LEGE 03274 TaxID=1828756 RepID=A0ABR9V3G3_9CHRO|nr:hypothetical protein [Cyanobacterium stanieri]MBE9222435.1 hypothetical protein [Cyanobacterium stanieri LEGE 03274]
MSKIQEIKAQIRDGNIDQAMAIAMSEALKIEIVTSSSPQQTTTQDIHFRSIINLLENEIENELGNSFEDQGNGEKVQKIHFQEVDNAHQRILQNIQSLQNMFALLQENS